MEPIHAKTSTSSAVFADGVLAGQIAVVTGGGSGLGRETALELARCGAQVIVCGRRFEALSETAAMSRVGSIEPMACDIREEEQVASFVDGVIARHGHIDLLVNNAGGQYLTPAENITPKGFRAVVRTNLEGTWLMTHAVATKAMMPGSNGRPPGGKIVSITLSPHNGMAGMAHSSAARAAVENLTRVLSVEWARFGIRLTAIAAGQFATDTFLTKYPEQIVDAAAGMVPVQRLGRPEELAWLVAYLASPGGDFFSGAVLTLDGARDNWWGCYPPRVFQDGSGNHLSEQRG